MNPLASRLKSALLQQTNNLKYDLLINTNLHNHPNLQQKLQQRQKNKLGYAKRASNQPHNKNQHLPQQISAKQLKLQANLQNKMNNLKRRTYSERKLAVEDGSANVSKGNLINQKNTQLSQIKRKRLVSASSSKNIQNSHFNTQLVGEKQNISKNSTSKLQSKSQKSHSNLMANLKNVQKNSEKLTANISNTVGPWPVNSSKKQSNSTSRQRNVTPIKSDRLTIMPFSIEPASSKQALQSKIYGLSIRNKEDQHFMLISQSKKITKQDKALSQNVFLNSLNNSLSLFIKDGLLIESNLDFKHFLQIVEKKKIKNMLIGQNLQTRLQEIKKFAFRYEIRSSSIQVCKIFELENRQVTSNWEILNLFSNWNNLIQHLKKGNCFIPGVIFFYPDQQRGKNLAADKIIHFFRFIRDRNYSKKLVSLMKKVVTIQKYWRKALITKRHRQLVLQKAQHKLSQCNKMQQKFVSSYPLIKTSRKTQIHIGSLAFESFKRITLESKSQFQNTQISRIFKSLQNPDTFIIYVTPFQISESVIKYYERLFKIATGKDSAMKEKVYFIYPQNTQRLSRICQSTTLNCLLCSPKGMKRIKSLIKSISSIQSSYIVPSFPSIQYTNLSYELQIPIYSSSQTLSKLYSTKIGFREIIADIIQKQRLNSPPFSLLKSVSSIFSEKQLINTLALLIYKNQQVKRWYFKIDDEFNSRGVAYFNVNSINFIKRLNQGGNQDVLGQIVHDQKEIIQLIALQIKEKIKKRIKILHKNIYPNYQQFITHFLTRGGVIQAAPKAQYSDVQQMTVSFLIQPNGDFQILGTFRKLQSNSKSVCQTIEHPAKVAEKIDVQKIIRHLYRRLYIKKKLFGYFTLDLLVQKAQGQNYIPYVIGLNCFLSIQASSLFILKQLTKIKYNKDRNTFSKIDSLLTGDDESLKASKISKVQFERQQLRYFQNQPSHREITVAQKSCTTERLGDKSCQIRVMYCPNIMLPNLQSMAQFFRKCKFQNIAFDLKTLFGTVFLPIDELQCQHIGLIICEKGQKRMNNQVLKVVEFLSRSYRKNYQPKNNPKKLGKKDIDQVGMLRGVILAQMHKSEQFKKFQKESVIAENCQATFNNLQSF